jgi:hypothetical protein
MWTRSRPLARPSRAFAFSQIPFAISQMAQVSRTWRLAPCNSVIYGVVGMEFFQFAGEGVNICGCKLGCRRRREESQTFRLIVDFYLETRHLVSYFPPAAARCSARPTSSPESFRNLPRRKWTRSCPLARPSRAFTFGRIPFAVSQTAQVSRTSAAGAPVHRSLGEGGSIMRRWNLAFGDDSNAA